MNLLCKIGLHKWVHCQEDDFWIRWPYVICRKCFTMKLDVEGMQRKSVIDEIKKRVSEDEAK